MPDTQLTQKLLHKKIYSSSTHMQKNTELGQSFCDILGALEIYFEWAIDIDSWISWFAASLHSPISRQPSKPASPNNCKKNPPEGFVKTVYIDEKEIWKVRLGLKYWEWLIISALIYSAEKRQK